MMTPRLIRRRPFLERFQSCFDIVELCSAGLEILTTQDWDSWQRKWATTFGVALNVVFVIARANMTGRSHGDLDDVFGNNHLPGETSSLISTFIAHSLVLFSLVNTFHTFRRQRHYRLFERPRETQIPARSARRVPIDSSPIASSPLRFLSKVILSEDSATKPAANLSEAVWELAVWDPLPICLRLFCLFSPGHVLIYCYTLPIVSNTGRPSTTIAVTLCLAALISAQLVLLCSNFSQQCKDTAVIHKEVMHEYDTKFVHPRTQKMMRDIGTQASGEDHTVSSDSDTMVKAYTPSYLVNKGFHIKPNPIYASRLTTAIATEPCRTPQQNSPTHKPRTYTAVPRSHGLVQESRIEDSHKYRKSEFSGDGGNLGIFSHASSPLKTSTTVENYQSQNRNKRFSSPVKNSERAPSLHQPSMRHTPDPHSVYRRTKY